MSCMAFELAVHIGYFIHVHYNYFIVQSIECPILTSEMNPLLYVYMKFWRLFVPHLLAAVQP
jgi:hypothetical protein